MKSKNIIQACKISLYLLISLLSIIFILLIPVVSNAQSTAVTEGVTWLLSNQNPDGNWSAEPRIYLDTYTALETLFYLNVNNAQVSQAVSWLGTQDSNTSDDVAYRVLLLSLAGEDTTTALTTLLTFKNSDDGWGTDEDFSSDVLDTTLALLALNAINYPDLDTISSALFYLTNNQNTDGGFGFPSTGSGQDESNVYMTSLVLETLSLYKETFNLQSEIDNAVAYLLTKQNPDGAISSDISTVYETALALDALIASGADPSADSGQAFQNAIDYFLNTQLVNGSWNDDPYSTALALRALSNIKPNLTISSSDITFSDPAPTVGDTITIAATIHNKGVAAAEDVLVQFYNGDPDSSGILLGETVILLIPVNSDYTSNFDWTIPEAAANRIFVKIDPLDAIEELDETDNIAYRNLTSATLPDLSITSADIVFNPSPAMPGEVVTITATVRNNGETAAENVTVDFYNGNPDSAKLWRLNLHI